MSIRLLTLSFFVVLAGIFLALGCGKSTPSSFDKSVDPVLQPYVSQFYAEAASRGVTTFPHELGSVSFEEATAEGDSGKCYLGTRNVTISSTFFVTATESLREQIIFHELGHCVLGLEHQNERLDIELPLDEEGLSKVSAECSLMAAKQSGTIYPWYRRHYLDALFAGGKLVDFKAAKKEILIALRKKWEPERLAFQAQVDQLVALAEIGSPIQVKVTFQFSFLRDHVLRVSPMDLRNPDGALRSLLGSLKSEKLNRNLEKFCSEKGRDSKTLCSLSFE